MKAYYNEHDRRAAAWLRELIRGGHIADGDVDERSIADVRPADLSSYGQCHFFAGIGGWSLALRLAGIPDEQPVWTGSCPCQPFSSAGLGLGAADPRHLWPEFRRLIAECSPSVCFGEQVASAAGRGWIAGVRADLEALGYGVGAADLCAASKGAPHIRQRLYWMACGAGGRWQRAANPEQQAGRAFAELGSVAFGVGDAASSRQKRIGERLQGKRRTEQLASKRSSACRMEHSEREGRAGESLPVLGPMREDYWADFDILPCTDGKARRIEPGSFPLAHGVPGRVGLLRGYGNAIVPQVAAEFVEASMEALMEVFT